MGKKQRAKEEKAKLKAAKQAQNGEEFDEFVANQQVEDVAPPPAAEMPTLSSPAVKKLGAKLLLFACMYMIPRGGDVSERFTMMLTISVCIAYFVVAKLMWD